MSRPKRSTKATRGKLERALDALESFLEAGDINKVVSSRELIDLRTALDTIAAVESRLYRGVSI